jgi:hypothetical protein
MKTLCAVLQKRWMKYWIVYSFFTVAELILDWFASMYVACRVLSSWSLFLFLFLFLSLSLSVSHLFYSSPPARSLGTVSIRSDVCSCVQ